MIASFKDPDAYELVTKRKHRDYTNILSAVLRKLDQLDAAGSLADLKLPPGNRLEALGGDRAGQHSIRINNQYRLCFVWKGDGPHQVEITDYH
jgi:proteic killer suppression protein